MSLQKKNKKCYYINIVTFFLFVWEITYSDLILVNTKLECIDISNVGGLTIVI